MNSNRSGNPQPPPTWADRLLNWLVAPHLREEVLGDSHERYYRRLQRLGPAKARRLYWQEMLAYLRPSMIKRETTNEYTSPYFLSPDMLRNYVTVAWRNLSRNRAFSIINLLGLALGMACSLLIMLWVQDERSVDRFHANGNHLYQVYERQYFEGKAQASYFTQGLLADELKRTIPEIQYASAIESSYPTTFANGDKIIKMSGTFAGADFFHMFSYPFLQGTPATALGSPGGIAISRKMADQFFESPEQAMGQSIRYENKEDLRVTAVFDDLPANSSQQFDFLRPWVDFVKENEWAKTWTSTDPMTYVQLRPDRDGKPADRAKVEAKIKDFIARYLPKSKGFVVELGLQPYPEKYLHSTFKNGQLDGGRIEYVRLFSIVAVVILLIACINFMNLATARSTKRAREVGVRKVIGAGRSSLIGQFVGEALLITFASTLIALLLVVLLLPAFSTLTGKMLVLPIGQPVFWAFLVGLLALTGLVAGSYPALFLSSLSPISVLKGSGPSARLRFNPGTTFFRQALVVFQFGLSILFIVGTIVVYRQMHYVQTKNLGYNRENLIYVPIEGDLIQKYDLFKDELAKQAGIVSISRMRESPTEIGHHVDDVSWPGKDPNLRTAFANTAVGYDFVKTLKLKLRDGRDFSPEFGTDSISYIINETAAAKIGAKNPVGQSLDWGRRTGKVIGVLADFHFNSMRQSIEPLIIRLDKNAEWGTILVRTEAGKTKEALANLEKICKALNPKTPFTYQFSDQEYAKLYRSEQVVSQLANYFAVLAIFISCLGLFGLATFTAEQRTKEIGVRKVLGASVASVVAMLSTDFLKLVLVAIVIASPVAWYVMQQWLKGFIYKMEIEWWVFLLAGLLSAGIALLTISYQSIKAALMNPVKSLRSE
ncbi:ABC transporter permease [Spirosoma sp. RP8]|uniref:ABC transporter permease n=1 Tax=Spirosoma liriopis TaxID=2937440 RepID=A0ABT0HL70_9BACT|nr:ABC transporter permease [Spirosoma liriopis]MCK8492700.1 ABC transporter permease [Spirosoma liriopis]